MNPFPANGREKWEVDEKKVQTNPELTQVFAEVVEDFTAGDPEKEHVRWVSLKPGHLQDKLAERNCQVSFYIIHQLLDQAGLRRRSYLKSASLNQVPFRDEQFNKIAAMKARFLDAGLPVLSIDTKKKELLGNFHRAGHYYDQQPRRVNDHDFKSYADGQVIPHGIYDIADNFGYLTLGTSRDTSAFVCDNLARFWGSDLQWKYPDADSMLLLCDGGGSNNARHHIVKQNFYELAQLLDINIVVAHYPPYCSKWNPIEHRLFCHLHRAWEGSVFHDMQTVMQMAEMTHTNTGLGLKVNINTKQYQIKRKVNEQFKNNINQYVYFDDEMPQWNYALCPEKRKLIY